MYGRRLSQDEIDLENRKAVYKDFKRWQKLIAAKNGWDADDPRLYAGFIKAAQASQDAVLAGVRVCMNAVKVPYRVGRVSRSLGDAEAVHYQVKIWFDQSEKLGYVFQYSQGSGIKQFPTIREILFSFLQDAVMGSESYIDFCLNTGADEDSRDNFRSYETCVEVFDWFTSNRIYRAKLDAMLGILQVADEAGDLNVDPPATANDELPD